MQFSQSGYRQWLRQVLVDRSKKNPKYSLRAMARGFSLSPALLSQILNGKRNLTLKKATTIATRMKLGTRDREYLYALVEYENAKDPLAKGFLEDRVNRFTVKYKFRTLETDSFRLLSDWYHFPVLQMLQLTEFDFLPGPVAARLGITPQMARDAIDRLVRLELIQKIDSKYAPVYEAEPRVESKVANSALQKFHREMLEKAITSLTTQSPQEKYIGSETIPIDVSQLPKVNEMINEFMDELLTYLKTGKRFSEVYHLNVIFFRLTKLEHK